MVSFLPNECAILEQVDRTPVRFNGSMDGRQRVANEKRQKIQHLRQRKALQQRQQARYADWLTAREAAELVGCSVATVNRYLNRGWWRGVLVDGPTGPHWRIDPNQRLERKSE